MKGCQEEGKSVSDPIETLDTDLQENNAAEEQNKNHIWGFEMSHYNVFVLVYPGYFTTSKYVPLGTHVCEYFHTHVSRHTTENQRTNSGWGPCLLSYLQQGLFVVCYCTGLGQLAQISRQSPASGSCLATGVIGLQHSHHTSFRSVLEIRTQVCALSKVPYSLSHLPTSPGIF